jgi:hypothetical protein
MLLAWRFGYGEASAMLLLLLLFGLGEPARGASLAGGGERLSRSAGARDRLTTVSPSAAFMRVTIAVARGWRAA